MVLDLQDATHTLAEQISQSHIRLLGSSAAPLQLPSDDDDSQSENGSDSGFESNSEDEDDNAEHDDERPVASGSGGGDRGRTTPRQLRSMRGLSTHDVDRKEDVA